MWRRRLTVALCATAALALGASAAGANESGTAARQRAAPSRAPAPSTDLAGTVLSRDGTIDGTPSIYDGNSFLGPDGLYYERSPLMVPGANGTVYFGEEMDIACAVGDRYKRSL